MPFDARDLKAYAEPLSGDELKEGAVYFSLLFADDEMLFPVLEPIVFVGIGIDPEELDQVYFQDLDSFLRGVRHDTASEDNPASFYLGSKDELDHIFEYEKALEVLMACSLRRRKVLGEPR